jgi:hypothetical protein
VNLNTISLPLGRQGQKIAKIGFGRKNQLSHECVPSHLGPMAHATHSSKHEKKVDNYKVRDYSKIK